MLNKCFLNSFFTAGSAYATFRTCCCLHAAIGDAYSKATVKHFFSPRHVQGLQSEGHAYLCNDKKLCDFMCNLQAWNGTLIYYVIFWKFKMLLFLLTLVTGDFVLNFKIAQFELSSRQTHFVLQQWKQPNVIIIKYCYVYNTF